MSCGGGHLGFPIGIKNSKLVKNIPMIIPGHVFCSDMKFKMAATAGVSLTLDPKGKMFQNASSRFPISKKNINLVKDIPMIIHLQFGFSQFISFREEDL
jgi:hypothetical protein